MAEEKKQKKTKEESWDLMVITYGMNFDDFKSLKQEFKTSILDKWQEIEKTDELNAFIMVNVIMMHNSCQRLLRAIRENQEYARSLFKVKQVYNLTIFNDTVSLIVSHMITFLNKISDKTPG